MSETVQTERSPHWPETSGTRVEQSSSQRTAWGGHDEIWRTLGDQGGWYAAARAGLWQHSQQSQQLQPSQPTMDEPDIKQLRKALAGDTIALRSLVECMTPVVRARVARALLRRVPSGQRDLSSDVADFTQEVFVALFSSDAKALRAWDPTRGLSLRNFVGLLAQHRVAELLRTTRWQRQYAEVELDERYFGSMRDLGADIEASSASHRELSRMLEYLEANLTTRALEMFERLYVQGQSVEQVSAETGLKSDAIYQWRSRLAKAVREARSHLQVGPGDSRPPLPLGSSETSRTARRSR